MKYLTLVVAAILTVGCVSVEMVAESVKSYCEAATPMERSILRERMALATVPHRMTVECYAVQPE